MRQALILIGQRPEAQNEGWYLLAGVIAFFVAIALALVVAARADARERVPSGKPAKSRKRYRLSTRTFQFIGYPLAVAVGVASFFTSLALLPLEQDKVPAWAAQVERWAADTYGVEAGADGFGRGDAVDCVAANTGPCYQAALLLPGRVEKAQLAFPNEIPTLISVTTGQPLVKAGGAGKEGAVRLSSKGLDKQLARRYGLPGSIDVGAWPSRGKMDIPSTAHSISDLFGGGTAADCPAGADNCATGTVLGRDGQLHPASLVSVDGVHAILVDPATGAEFPRAGSGS
ncbi:hypothetical protein LSHI6S_00048 [Leifsonia shinshuensis]